MNNPNPTTPPGMGPAGDEQGPQFFLQNVYLKDCSFEAPNTPAIFREEWKPQMSVNLDASANRLPEAGIFEVVIQVTVTVKVGDKTAFLAEVHQAGVFTAVNFPEQELERMLGAYCPNILFPFAREAIASLVAKGGFPQLMLQPFNFEALYLQKQQQQAQPH